MASEQTILFTVMPRGISLNSATAPVSVFVSPRLDGADHLGAFPDWLNWTRHLRDDGLKLEVHCGANTRVFPINGPTFGRSFSIPRRMFDPTKASMITASAV